MSSLTLATSHTTLPGPLPTHFPINTTIPFTYDANGNRLQNPPPPLPGNFSDWVYANKHGVPLELRVWPAQVDGPAPWLMYTHGGGWATGRHYDPNPWVIQAFRPEGYHVVSVAYRMFPEAVVEDMYEDEKDAFEWAYKNLPDIIGEGFVDPATMSFLPKPKAVMALYPVTDLADPAYFPDPLAPTASPNLTWFSPQQCYAGLKNRGNLSAAITYTPGTFEINYQSLNLTRELWQAPWIEYSNRAYLQLDMQTYLAAHGGTLPFILRQSDFNCTSDFKAHVASLNPFDQVQEKGWYPPTYLMHGFQDPVVNITQSYRFAERLRNLGVDVGEWYQNGSHVFDYMYRNGTAAAGWSEFVTPALAFANRYTKGN